MSEVQRTPKRIIIEDIQRVVARHYDITKPQLLSRERKGRILMARHVAMYLSRTMTPRSLPEIASRFHKMHHTTVMHGVKKIEGMREENALFATVLEHLKHEIEVF